MGLADRYRVPAGGAVVLADWPTDDATAAGWEKAEAKERLAGLTRELRRLQRLLYAVHRHRLLVALQGMDTSGKSGTIRHVFSRVDPLGVRVAAFSEPTPDELDRDFLWRVHRRVPAAGEIVLFDRSHYEDVVTTRVRSLVPAQQCERRYGHIREFERMLVEEGTTVLKFFLHISYEEQAERLQARRDKPHKRWKLQPADFTARDQWEAYMQAYDAALAATSTDWAPWVVVPADRKSYRNLVVAETVVATLQGLGMEYPGSE